MSHYVKHGDVRTLTFNLGRNLTGVTQQRVVIRSDRKATVAVDRNGTIVGNATDGIVALALASGDYVAGKLDPSPYPYWVEIETQPGPITHPSGIPGPYERLWVYPDLD
jgi:hypothetical protein